MRKPSCDSCGCEGFRLTMGVCDGCLAGAETPLGCCHKCGKEIDVRTGADGSLIVPLGRCADCDLVTIWQPVLSTAANDRSVRPPTSQNAPSETWSNDG